MPRDVAREVLTTGRHDVAAAVADARRHLADNKRISDENNQKVQKLIELLSQENAALVTESSAIFNIMEDFSTEKEALEDAHRATLNILQDADEEKGSLVHSHRAILNILEDFEQETAELRLRMSAVFNVLDDLAGENVWLDHSQIAMLNLLEDLDDERRKAAAAAAVEARAAFAESHAAELDRVNDALSAANKELEGFSYSVSHDLRTPLRAIDGFSRILLEDYADKLDAEGQRVLNVVRESTVKMAHLIDDILAFSRAGRTEMNLVPVDMEAIVRDTLGDTLAPALAGRTVAIEIGNLPSTQGDRAMLARVWTNLLDNAIKFTGPKPDARIEIGAMSGDRETVYFVRDNGIGFDMQYAGKLFGVFQRLHGVEIAGTGIGLAIVKRIVTRHGGRVWAEGKVDEGAAVYFALPNQEQADG